MTPHSLRRTFASLLFALGRTAPEVMEQLGHTDPKLTLRIYARAMRQEAGERERLQELAGELGAALSAATDLHSGDELGLRATREAEERTAATAARNERSSVRRSWDSGAVYVQRRFLP